MTDDGHRAAYAAAFIKQARSDWLVFRALSEPPIAFCHRLHYLQMACEKLAKAYRLRDTSSPIDELISKHTGFEKFIGAFFLAIKSEYVGKHKQLETLIRTSRNYAREVEKLAPAIDRVCAPENAEYPWERDGAIVVPCEYTYPGLVFLRERGGFAFLNLIQRALNEYETLASICKGMDHAPFDALGSWRS
jgi:hypothetical protein